MENDEQLKGEESFNKYERLLFVYAGIVGLTLVGEILLIVQIIHEKNDICITYIIVILAVCLLLLLVLVICLFNKRLKQMLEYSFNQHENEKKRAYEKGQSEQNQEYRLETLKWEKIHQIAKLVLEKEKQKDDENDKKKDTINIPVAKSLIEAIKEIKEEIERIEPKKTT
jgi:hypothetical protein